jgi:hypothetical protein
MHFISHIYLLILVGWAVFDTHDLICSGYPRIYSILEIVSKLTLVVFSYIGLLKPMSLEMSVAAYILYVAMITFFTLRTLAFKSEELDLDLSEKSNFITNLIGYVLTVGLCMPAIYIASLASHPSFFSPFILFSASIGGLFLGMFLKRANHFKSIQERKLSQWLSSREIEYTDLEVIHKGEAVWPGFEKEARYQIFKVVCSAPSQYAITGPYIHSMQIEQPEESHEEILNEFKTHFANLASNSLIKRAASDMPEDFRKLVDEALDEIPRT